MKRKIFSLIGIAVLVAVIGLSLAGCDTDTGGDTTYTVSFDAGDGSGTPPASQTVNAGQSITLPNQGTMTAPTGKSFNGWQTGGQNYAAGVSYTVNGNVTFTAQWGTTSNGGDTTYTVSFDAGDGSGTPPASQTVNAGQSITLPAQGTMTAPTGKSFNGWQTGGQNYAAGASYTVNGNVTFTAQWGTTSGDTYTVTFDVGDGSGTPPTSQTVNVGQNIALPGQETMTAPTGKSFNGWQTGGQNYAAGASYTVNGNVTFTAQWQTTGGDNSSVTFSSVTADGSTSQTTSQLTLTFSAAITSLSANDITLSGVSGVTAGTLSGSNPYTLGVSGHSAGGTLTVSVSKSGYTIAPTSKSVTIYYYTGGGGGTSGSAPSVPSGVSASVVSSSSITVSWSAVTGATSYKVYRSSSSSGTYTQVGTPTTTSYSNTGLSASTTYYYKVSAVNSYGESAQSSYASATTSAAASGTAPNPPSSVTVSGTSSISVSWSSVSGATSYEVYKRNPASGTYELKDTRSSTSYSDSSPHPGINQYAVKAKNSYGTSGANTGMSSTIPLSTPSISNISYGTGTQTLEILINPVSGATSYQVYWATTSSGTYTILGAVNSTVVLAGKVDFTYNIPRGAGLAYYKVQAVWETSYGSPSRVTSSQSSYQSFTIPN